MAACWDSRGQFELAACNVCIEAACDNPLSHTLYRTDWPSHSYARFIVTFTRTLCLLPIAYGTQAATGLPEVEDTGLKVTHAAIKDQPFRLVFLDLLLCS